MYTLSKQSSSKYNVAFHINGYTNDIQLNIKVSLPSGTFIETIKRHTTTTRMGKWDILSSDVRNIAYLFTHVSVIRLRLDHDIIKRMCVYATEKTTLRYQY